MAADLTERHHLPRTRTATFDGGKRGWRLALSDALNDFLPNPGAPVSSRALPWRARFEHFEWGFFTLNLGTGACALLVGAVPFDFRGREALGSTFLGLNIIFYMLNLAGTGLKMMLHPRAFAMSFVVPGQALFFPTSILALAGILVGLVDFVLPHAGPKFLDVLVALFWVYVGLSTACAAILQWTMYDQVRDFEGVMPSECLPVLPLMLAGTVGASLALHTDGERAATLLVASYVFQGCGFLIATMKLSTWMSRNVLFGHPHDTRIVPIFFMAVGPPGFTASAFVSLGRRAAQLFADNTPVPGDALFAASFLVALMLFGQCLWFLLATSVIWLKSATRPGRPVGWSLAWFATTFPLSTCPSLSSPLR
ncbi:C4-dicarboxylate transporter/malic acid transport protein [Auricularia subglabra TFB-10046 SS5]|nr:C4-dicarboxylate transporter/malic acid transport protein [Auricularia subglabra TFB-10046 SS5]